MVYQDEPGLSTISKFENLSQSLRMKNNIVTISNN